jgi:hypothetical protein
MHKDREPAELLRRLLDGVDAGELDVSSAQGAARSLSEIPSHNAVPGCGTRGGCATTSKRWLMVASGLSEVQHTSRR